MNRPARLLHLDDNPDDAQLIVLALEAEQERFPTVLNYVRTQEEFLAALDRKEFDIILSDYRMAGFDGDQALEAARGICPDIPFIMVTGEMGEERAVETLQRGATDYVLKSRIFRLVPAIRRALHEAEEHRKIREAERALNQSEERLRAIFENVGVGILEIDAGEHILAANDRICQILGYAREELLGMTLGELTAPQDREESDNVNADIREGRHSTFAYEKRYLKRNGLPLWAHVTVSAIRDSGGRYLRSVGTIEDISERKLLERKIGDIARFPDENPSPILRVSLDGWVQYANHASDPLLAAWRSHVGGKVPGEIRDSVRIALLKDVPQTITCSLGESTYSIVFTPVLTRNYVNLYARNITELEKAEQAALLAQRQRSDILESIQDPFFALDRSWHFTFVNDKAQCLWRKKPGDMIGRSVWEIFPEPIGGAAYEDLRRSMVDRQVRHIETLSQSAETWFELHVYPTSDGGLAVTYRDIDARRKLEEALSIERATLQTAFENLPIGTAIADSTGKIVSMNTASLRLHGFQSLQDMCQRAEQYAVDWELLHPDGTAMPLDEWPISRAVRGQYVADFEVHLRHRTTGRTWTGCYNVAPVHNRAGKVELIVFTIQDITGRKQAEQELSESEHRYRSMFANTHAVMILVDPATGRIVDANPAAERFYGWSREDLLAMHIGDINQASPDEIQSAIGNARTASQPVFFFKHRLASGSIRDVEVYSGPVHLRGKEVLLSIIHDITDRSRSKETAISSLL